MSGTEVVYINWELNVTMSSEYAWKISARLTFKQRHATELGNDQAQCLSPLNIFFVSVLEHLKQVVCTQLLLRLFYHFLFYKKNE